MERSISHQRCGRILPAYAAGAASNLDCDTRNMITVGELAALARLSRRQIDRLRKLRPEGFPREYELGSGTSKYRSCPRFRRNEVHAWLDSRALW